MIKISHFEEFGGSFAVAACLINSYHGFFLFSFQSECCSILFHQVNIFSSLSLLNTICFINVIENLPIETILKQLLTISGQY